MSDWFSKHSFASCLAVAALVSGCEGGVGDPCVPEEEFLKDFSGFSLEQVNVESRSFQCETRICLVNHFEGRVSCPYGHQKDVTSGPASTNPCHIPGSNDEVTADVPAQRVNRRADDTVYCSCRCGGPDKNARYCDCPNGYGCVKLVDDLSLGSGQLAGSYCIKDGTSYDSTAAGKARYSELCNPMLASCGNDGQNP